MAGKIDLIHQRNVNLAKTTPLVRHIKPLIQNDDCLNYITNDVIIEITTFKKKVFLLAFSLPLAQSS